MHPTPKPTPAGSVPASSRIPPHHLAIWQNYAKKHGVTVSELIRFSVNKHLLSVAEQPNLKEIER